MASLRFSFCRGLTATAVGAGLRAGAGRTEKACRRRGGSSTIYSTPLGRGAGPSGQFRDGKIPRWCVRSALPRAWPPHPPLKTVIFVPPSAACLPRQSCLPAADTLLLASSVLLPLCRRKSAQAGCRALGTRQITSLSSSTLSGVFSERGPAAACWRRGRQRASCASCELACGRCRIVARPGRYFLPPHLSGLFNRAGSI